MTACPVCGEPVVSEAATLQGHDGVVGLLVERVPAVRCSREHRTVADPRAVVDGATALLPTADRRWRQDRCGGCGARLTLPARRTTRVLSVVLPPLVTVTVEAPLTRCPSCAVEQVRAAVGRRVRRSLEALLGSD